MEIIGLFLNLNFFVEIQKSHFSLRKVCLQKNKFSPKTWVENLGNSEKAEKKNKKKKGLLHVIAEKTNMMSKENYLELVNLKPYQLMKHIG